MKITDVLSKVDHTMLRQTATWEEIQALCDDGIQYGVASVCIPPSFVKQAKEYVGNKLAVCTVIGFPNGYHTTETKCFETRDACANGADEIDMVINLGWVKEKQYGKIQREIQQIKQCCGTKILKVIVETCLLTEEEKIRMCQVVSQAGADFIKTSTGFSTGGATEEDIALFAKYVAPEVRIKAAGGIDSVETAEKLLKLGACRLGTSRIVKQVKKSEQ